MFTEKITSQPKKDPVQERLDQTASLINDLQATQKERLSAKLPTHLAHVPGPSEKEIQLAQKVTQELKELAKGVSQQLHFLTIDQEIIFFYVSIFIDVKNMYMYNDKVGS